MSINFPLYQTAGPSPSPATNATADVVLCQVTTTSPLLLPQGKRREDNNPNLCQYKKGLCQNPKALKRNGRPHTLCEYHRSKQISYQRKFELRARGKKPGNLEEVVYIPAVNTLECLMQTGATGFPLRKREFEEALECSDADSESTTVSSCSSNPMESSSFPPRVRRRILASNTASCGEDSGISVKSPLSSDFSRMPVSTFAERVGEHQEEALKDEMRHIESLLSSLHESSLLRSDMQENIKSVSVFETKKDHHHLRSSTISARDAQQFIPRSLPATIDLFAQDMLPATDIASVPIPINIDDSYHSETSSAADEKMFADLLRWALLDEDERMV